MSDRTKELKRTNKYLSWFSLFAVFAAAALAGRSFSQGKYEVMAAQFFAAMAYIVLHVYALGHKALLDLVDELKRGIAIRDEMIEKHIEKQVDEGEEEVERDVTE